MANNLTAYGQLEQNRSDPNSEHGCDSQANKLMKGMTVYKRETGMAFEVVNVSHANGIMH